VLLFSLAILALGARGEEVSMFRGNPAHTGADDGPGIAHLSGVRWIFSAGGEVYSSPAAADRMIFIGSTNGNLYAIRQETGAQVWKFETRGRIVSSPAVVAGIVDFNSYDSTFYAVDEFTGQLQWKFSTNGELRFAAKHIHGMEAAPELMPDPFDFFLSSPVVANGVVYFGSGDHYVCAVDAATGGLKWKFRTGDVVHATPASADNALYRQLGQLFLRAEREYW
jgi:eukaryotic-like serine/threonine-protein kinase